MLPKTSPAPVLKHFDYDPKWVIYADAHIVVASKPSGLLSVPGRGPDKQLCFANLLAEEFPEIRIIHRLDMDTSGLMVLALNADAHRHLSRQFQERQTQKRYQAVCSGILEQNSGECLLPMRCDWENRPRQMVDFIHGKSAHTNYQLTEQRSDRFLVELTPITGRSHQLRLHMKMLGHPILGDNLYADIQSLKASPRLLLHACHLAFHHPVSRKWLEFNVPADF